MKQMVKNEHDPAHTQKTVFTSYLLNKVLKCAWWLLQDRGLRREPYYLEL